MAYESGDDHGLTNLEARASRNQSCYQFCEVLVLFFRDTEFHFSGTGYALCTCAFILNVRCICLIRCSRLLLLLLASGHAVSTHS
jgi:hypothetical protein